MRVEATVPVKAGIWWLRVVATKALGSRFRGNDEQGQSGDGSFKA